MRLQIDDALRCRDLHSPEVGDVRDCGDDPLLLSGSPDGSFAIVWTPFHGKCVAVIMFV